MDYTEVIDKLKKEHGFKQISEYRSGNFGDFIIALENSDMLLRILRDRDFLSLEIATKNYKRWYDLAFIEPLFNPREDLINNVVLFEDSFHLFENNYDKLKSMFSDEFFLDTDDRMQNLMQRRKEQLMESWRKKD